MTFEMSGKVETMIGKISYFLAATLFLLYPAFLILMKQGIVVNVFVFLIICFYTGSILEKNGKNLKKIIVTEEAVFIKSWKENSKYDTDKISVHFQKYSFEKGVDRRLNKKFILVLLIGANGEELNRIFLYDVNKKEEIIKCLNKYGIIWISKLERDLSL